MTWIPVQSALPPPAVITYDNAPGMRFVDTSSVPVLAWLPDGRPHVALAVYQRHRRRFEAWHGIPLALAVTHWMPLPDGPT